MHADRYAAPVVRDRHAVVAVDGDLDLVAVARQRFVDAVVDYFVHKMMQAPDRRAAYIHSRPAPDSLQSFQYLDLIGTIVAVYRGIIYRH